MKLAYFGTAAFAVPALKALAPSVQLVVSQPDRPRGRGMKLMPSEVKAAALELGIPVQTPEKARAMEFVDFIRDQGFDALVVAAYGQILSTSLLEAAHRGGINLHGSILPLYRGAAPIQRCLLDGHSETGVTLMQMDRGMDSGDMIAIGRLTIGEDETAGELQDRLALLAAEMAADWMPRIVLGDYPRTPQNHELHTLAPKVTKAEAQIHPSESATVAYNRFRAFTPAPGAWAETTRGRLKISGMRRAQGEGAPGQILETKGRLIVAQSEGALEWVTLQPAGQKSMSGSDYANGNRLRPGDVLF